MVKECLEEAGRLLQEEINKQLGVVGCQETETDGNDEASTPPAGPAPGKKMGTSMDMREMDGMDMDDPMIAEFFAKQMMASKKQPPELPLKAWAANIIQAKNRGTVGGENPTNASPKQRELQLLVDRLCATFFTLQKSS